MSWVDKILAGIIVVVLIAFGISGFHSNRTCTDNDAAAAQLIERHYGAQMQGEPIEILAETPLPGGMDAPYRIKGFQTKNRSWAGIAVFREISRGRLELMDCYIRFWEPVLHAYEISLYDEANQAQKTYNLFLVMDERIRSIEEARYISDGKTLQPGRVENIQAPCVVAFAAPEPEFAYHRGGYAYYDGEGNLLT